MDNFLTVFESGSNISIIRPTRDVVEFLVENNFAEKLTESIVTSAISFDMLEDDIIGDTDLNGIVPSTSLYDLNLCSPIFLRNISQPGVCEILYQNVLPYDDKKYNCTEFRNSIDIDEYFHDIKMAFLNNEDEFNRKLIELKQSLPSAFFGYDELIGEGDELSDYFEGMIEEGLLDEKTAFKIRNQIKKEYENNEVTEQALTLRIAFLNDEDRIRKDMKSFEGITSQFDFFCPYCHSQVSVSNQYCHTCGYNTSEKGLLSMHDIKK